MKCFYHNADLDGICSAAIFHQKYPDAELIGINYGDPFPWDDIEPREPVCMVDFSLQPFSEMVKLRQLTDALVWIDHHKSALSDADKEGWKTDAEMGENSAVVVPGLRRDGIGACALIWEYWFPRKPLPRAVELLARYDVWDHEDSDTLPFQYGIRIKNYSHDPADPAWSLVLDESGEFGQLAPEVASCLEDGRAILRYIDNDNTIKAKALCFEHELMWPGKLPGEDLFRQGSRRALRCLAANFGPSNSKLFDSLWDPEKYDAMLLYSYRPKNKLWTISLYTTRDDVDVSVVAKAYGGGGHKGAAGFQVEELSEVGL